MVGGGKIILVAAAVAVGTIDAAFLFCSCTRDDTIGSPPRYNARRGKNILERCPKDHCDQGAPNSVVATGKSEGEGNVNVIPVTTVTTQTSKAEGGRNVPTSVEADRGGLNDATNVKTTQDILGNLGRANGGHCQQGASSSTAQPTSIPRKSSPTSIAKNPRKPSPKRDLPEDGATSPKVKRPKTASDASSGTESPPLRDLDDDFHFNFGDDPDPGPLKKNYIES